MATWSWVNIGLGNGLLPEVPITCIYHIDGLVQDCSNSIVYILMTSCKAAVTLLLYIDGLVQDCSNSIANALELLQSCTKPSIWYAYVCIICVCVCKWSPPTPGQTVLVCSNVVVTAGRVGGLLQWVSRKYVEKKLPYMYVYIYLGRCQHGQGNVMSINHNSA